MALDSTTLYFLLIISSWNPYFLSHDFKSFQAVSFFFTFVSQCSDEGRDKPLTKIHSIEWNGSFQFYAENNFLWTVPNISWDAFAVIFIYQFSSSSERLISILPSLGHFLLVPPPQLVTSCLCPTALEMFWLLLYTTFFLFFVISLLLIGWFVFLTEMDPSFCLVIY